MKKYIITFTLYLFILCSIWCGGLFYFVSNFNQQNELSDTLSDGIVVFTGSPGRINEGLSLLEKNISNIMLVTGVNKSSFLSTENWIKSKTLKYNCCIELETNAKNTNDNAKETINWINKNNLNSIHLVTSSYHILRSEIELKRIAPKDLIIIRHPVKDPNTRSLKSISYFILISLEYSKFIISLLQLRLGL